MATHLRHENVFSTQSIVGVGVVVIHGWDRYGCPLAEVPHSGNLRLGLEARHETTGDSSDELSAVDERD